MNPKKRIDLIKKKAFKYLTVFLKNKISKTVINNDEVKKILVCRPNHKLRNLLLLSPLVQELEFTFPNSEIDLLVNESCASKLYQNYENVNQIIEFPQRPFNNPIKYIKTFIKLRNKKYDLAINAVKESCSGRIFTSISKAKFKFIEHKNSDKKEIHLAKEVIYSLREFLSTIGVKENDAIPANLDLRLANDELIQGGISVYEIVQNAQPTICLFTYTTNTKYYTKNWWFNLYEYLKIAFPNENIIEILPEENASQIGFKAPTLYSNDIRELTAIIANTDVFIGDDNGVMHLASASLTPTIGLFTDTELEKYKPYNEGSAAVRVNELKINELITLIKNAIYSNT